MLRQQQDVFSDSVEIGGWVRRYTKYKDIVESTPEINNSNSVHKLGTVLVYSTL